MADDAAMNDQPVQDEKLLARLTSSSWPMVLVLVLALALRLINLAGRPMWYDEAFAVLYAEKPLAIMLYGTLTQVGGAAADVHPLFFYSMLHAWMLAAGQSPAAVRALSVLVGVATVGIVFLLARRLFDWQVGLAAALIVAVAPFHVYYSQEARMYAWLAFAATGMVYFFVRAWAAGGWLNWLGFGLLGALTLYAHNLGVMFLAALDLWLLWAWLRPARPPARAASRIPSRSPGSGQPGRAGRAREAQPEGLRPGAARPGPRGVPDPVPVSGIGTAGAGWRNLRPILISHLVMIGLFAPWLAVVPSQFGKIQQAYWVEQPGVARLIQTVLIFHFGYDNQSLPGWLLPPALFFSLLVLAILAFELIRQHRRPNLQPSHTTGYSLLPTPYSLLLSLTLGPVLLTFLASQIRPVYIVRALLPSALMYDVLVAGVLVAGRAPRPVKWGLFLPSALIVAAALINHYGYAQFPRPPFDQAAVYLRAHYQPSDVIVHSNKLTFLPTYYYDRSLPQAFIADEPGSPSDTLAYPTQRALGLFATSDIATATLGHERVWFVVFRREIDEYRAAGDADHPQRAWLESMYSRAAQVSFNDLELYLYEQRSP